MRDRIHAFLKQCGGQASGVAIARALLHLRSAGPAQADQLLAALLSDDPQVVSDGLGNWHLVASPAPAPSPPAGLVETPMRPAEIKRANAIVIGVGSLKEGELQESAVCCVVQDGSVAATELPIITAAAFWQQWSGLLQQAVLISWNPRPALLALGRIAAMARQPFLPMTTISLASLARQLLQLPRPPKLPALHAELSGNPSWQEGLSHRLSAETEIVAHLLERGRTQGMTNWEQLAELARRPARVNFGEFDFDEQFVAQLPEAPGVYLMKNDAGRVIYVGKAANLRNRLQTYFRQPTPEDRKLQQQQAQLRQLHFEVTETELDALLRENALIRRIKPALNRQQRIHAAATQPEKKRGIFIVPIKRPTGTAGRERVVVYFLSPQGLRRAVLPARHKPGKRLRQLLAAFWDEAATATTGPPAPEVEIAARWLAQNRSWVSMIDPEECRDRQEAERKLGAVLHARELFETSVRIVSPVVPD